MHNLTEVIYCLRDNESITITRNDILGAIQYKFTLVSYRGRRFSKGFTEHFTDRMPEDLNEARIVTNLLEIISEVRKLAQ